ncbi:MAG: rod shape-determining protein [Clostridia bacterium]|nr:rod shape-determining protein [Clostridia bacterium]
MAQVSDLGIDLGTSNVLIYQKGKGIVLRQPAVVAIERNTKKVLAVGNEAYRMIGRTPGNILAIRPLRQGVVNDFELTNTMLRNFMSIVVGKRLFSRPRVVLSVPTGVNESEKSNIVSILFDAGAKRTQLLDRPIAAAMGVGMDFQKPYGCMVVDMGAGVTDIAVLASGQVIEAASVCYGGDYFDDAIIRYLRKKHNLLIGERTAEEIKINLGSAVPTISDVTMEVTGRNLLSGLPKTQTITSMEVYEAVKDAVADLIEAIQGVIERTPPQLASDIFEDGIVLTGGAASLSGLAEAIYGALHIPCGVADDPQTSVVLGCGRALEDLNAYKSVLTDSRRGFMR